MVPAAVVVLLVRRRPAQQPSADLLGCSAAQIDHRHAVPLAERSKTEAAIRRARDVDDTLVSVAFFHDGGDADETNPPTEWAEAADGKPAEKPKMEPKDAPAPGD